MWPSALPTPARVCRHLLELGKLWAAIRDGWATRVARPGPDCIDPLGTYDKHVAYRLIVSEHPGHSSGSGLRRPFTPAFSSCLLTVMSL